MKDHLSHSAFPTKRLILRHVAGAMRCCFRCMVVLMLAGLPFSIADDTVDFGRDIGPILAANCFDCHGPDEEQRQADLRLDTPEGITATLESQGFAVVPGDPVASKLIQMITSQDPDVRMPPEGSEKTLTQQEIDLLTRWVEQGAEWKKHWAFEPIRREEVPQTANTAWPANDIDRYILSRLEQDGLTPVAPAEKRTLIRRATFDLIGLPPTLDEVAEFLADNSSDAFASVIDRLLASPHYGERWGRHWLDVARYADSNGADENHPHPHAYLYRNYVIEAFNRDLPYDQFLREQLAGDLLPAADHPDETFRQISGTGFLALGVKIIAEQDLVKKQADIVDEQLDTLSKSFMGLTLGCARCHDHKFDPIPTADYYGMAGILHSTAIVDRAVEDSDYLEAKRTHDKKHKTLNDKITTAQAFIDGQSDDLSGIEREAESFDRGNVLIDTTKYGVDVGVVNSSSDTGNYFEFDIPLKHPGDYVVQIKYAAAQVRPVQLLINGKVVKEDAVSRTTGGWYPQHQAWSTEGVYELQQGDNTLRLNSKTMAHLDKLRLIRIGDNKDLANNCVLLDELNAQLKMLETSKPSAPKLTSVQDGTISDTKIHLRGDHNSLGDVEPRHFLTLTHSKTSAALPVQQSGRLELANWLVSADHPLTARVIVNRVWGWHFGKGIVSTPDNFGLMGERPTHPKLLDYLARELIDNGWSLKRLHRLIMLSSAYQLASSGKNVAAMKMDPGNVLYWKANVRRLEAEAIRDSMLALTGELDRTVLGPAIGGVESSNLSTEAILKNATIYNRSRRRSVYLPVIRTAIYDVLTLYDFPGSTSPIGQRAVTTVPTQALMMMNSDRVATHAQSIVGSFLDGGESQTAAEVIQHLYNALFGRPPTSHEVQQGLEFLSSFSGMSAPAKTSDEKLRDAWSVYCHTLLMSNNFVYVQCFVFLIVRAFGFQVIAVFNGAIHDGSTMQNARHSVVIRRGNRIELVVMATCTSEC